MMVFEDPSRRRWRLALSLLACAVVIILVFGISIARSLWTEPVLAPLPPQIAAQPQAQPVEEPLEQKSVRASSPVVQSPHSHSPIYPSPLAYQGSLKTAFFIQNDPNSVKQLAAVGPSLDLVMPDYFSFSTASGKIVTAIDGPTHKKLQATGAGIMPRISNVDSRGNWRTREVTLLLHDADAQLIFIDNLINGLVACQAVGVNVDIESLASEDTELYVDFLDQLAQALHSHKLYLTVDVPMNEEQYDYEAIGKFADAVVLMAYDQHFSTGKPGAIASQEWFSDGVTQYVKRIQPEKLIIALGTYGYDWSDGRMAESLSFEDAISLAARYKSHIQTDADSINSTFSYIDDQKHAHTVWFLDAVSAWNQYSFMHDPSGLGIPGEHIGGVSMWRLGFEDPAIWDFLLAESLPPLSASTFSTLPAKDQVVFYGTGDLHKVRKSRADGERALSLDGRYITHCDYVSLPQSYEVERIGTGAANTVALTFDDGPDPTWTTQILDLLKTEKVPAAFFVVGREAERHPELLRREIAEGHIIGNHTFNHPRIGAITLKALHDELNSTQRAIEVACGRQTLLFRSPYDIDSAPVTFAQLEPLCEVTGLGYVSVGANVGAEDYTRLAPEQIVQKTLDQMKGAGPYIICFHDGGGDRSRTVQAVRSLIPILRSQGKHFVGLDAIAGTPVALLNPAVPAQEAAAATGAHTWAFFRSNGWTVISTIFIVSTIIGVLRISSLGIVMFFAWRKKRAAHIAPPTFTEPVTVIVPAYNEALVIERTINGILRSDYPNFQILVVDDGSTDNTADIVTRMNLTEPRVSVITKPNSGKAHALNLGFRIATTDIIVILDADTIVLPTTLSALVAPFADPKIDAVCGNVQVGNVRNLLTAMQDVEYVTCQNYDRRAFDALNCIGVVPGATGAWRRSTVLDAGGYSSDTLTEDADLTIEVLRRGGRIVYAPEARSITEAPETVGTLYKQRFRWSFGTFQTLWKHRRAFGGGSLGFIGMPNMLIFQVIFPMLAPIGDLVLLLALIKGDWNAIASGYFTFLTMDLLGSVVAFKLEGRPIWNVWSVLIQRFCYRQFMYVVTFSAAIAAIKGRRHGWNKLDRLASVHTRNEPEILEVVIPGRRPVVSGTSV